MKVFIFLLCSIFGCLAAHGQDKPASAFAEWKALPAGTLGENWNFWRAGKPVADGGSIFFDFTLPDGQVVSVVAAHTSYWTKEDLKKRCQPFFLYVGKKFHKFNQHTPEEASVVKAISVALEGSSSLNVRLLKRLLEQIENRKPLFNTKSR